MKTIGSQIPILATKGYKKITSFSKSSKFKKFKKNANRLGSNIDELYKPDRSAMKNWVKGKGYYS